jgi:hypothetical protein
MCDWIGPASRTPTRQELVKNETRKKKKHWLYLLQCSGVSIYETKDGKTKILKYFLELFPSTDF